MKINTRAPCTIQASGLKIPRLKISPAYSGGFLLLPDFERTPVVLDLSTISFAQENLPLLWHHDAQVILGHTTSLTCDGQEVSAEAELTAIAETSDSEGKRRAEEIVSKTKLGQRWEASVGTGAIADQDAALVPAGEKIQVNGREFVGPLFLIRNIRLVEISIVPVGADRDTAITITASGLLAGVKKMGFAAWLASKGIDPTTLTTDTAAELRGQYITGNPDADAAALDAEIAGLIKAEGDPEPAPEPTPSQEPPKDPAPEPVDGCGDQGKTISASGVAKAKQSAADYLQKFRGQTTITASGTRSVEPTKQQIATAALLQRFDGKKLEAAGLPSRAIDAATGLTWRAAGFHTLFREALRAAGISTSDMKSDELVQAGLSILKQNAARCRGGIAAAGMSSDYTSYVFKDTIDKAVMVKYADAEHPLSDIAKARTTRDFREVTDFRMGLRGSFEEVGPSGDAPMAKIEDEGWTAKIKKYMLGAKITFEQMCNDDCNVLDDISDFFVQKAVTQQEYAIAQAILGGISASFYTTVASAPFSIDGLAKAVAAFRKIKTLEGEFIGRQAKAVLVPTALEAAAEVIYQSTTVNETTTANKRSGATNIYGSKFTPITSPLLDSDSGISGGSDSSWFLLADQATSPIVAKAYMEGYLAPQVKQTDLSASYDILYTAMYTFAAKLYDARGGVYCTAS